MFSVKINCNSPASNLVSDTAQIPCYRTFNKHEHQSYVSRSFLKTTANSVLKNEFAWVASTLLSLISRLAEFECLLHRSRLKTYSEKLLCPLNILSFFFLYINAWKHCWRAEQALACPSNRARMGGVRKN